MPISRLVAVSFSPASSVLSSTFARTGRVLRLLTARLTTDSPRARFSCMTDSFTWATPTQATGPSALPATLPWRFLQPVPGGRSLVGAYLLSFFLPRHHRHHGVGRVDSERAPCRSGQLMNRPNPWTEAVGSGMERGMPGGQSSNRHPSPPRDRVSVHRGEPLRPPESAGYVHRRAWFSTDSRWLSTGRGPGMGFAAGPRRCSVGVDQLADRGDLAAQLVVDRHLAVDLVAGMQDRRMVAAAELC